MHAFYSIVNSQPLTNPLSTLASSSSLQSSLKLMYVLFSIFTSAADSFSYLLSDFTATSMTGTIPASISALSALTELHLDSNNLQTSLPSTLPATLQLLTLSNNTGITGSVPSAICALPALKVCDLSGTGLTFTGGSCGPCQLS
jgi:hypothetical protein